MYNAECKSECEDVAVEDLYESLDFSNIPVVAMELDNVMFKEYDEISFDEGIKSASYIAGQVTAFKNIGLSEENIITLIGLLYDKDTMATTMEHNIKMAQIQCVNVEKATI